MLNGQVTLVTGASRGIGHATAIAFAKAGAKVIIAARSGSTLENIAGQIAGLNGLCLPMQVNVADETGVRRLVECAAAHFGRIDVLVNNAGAIVYGPAERATLEDWVTVIGANLKGSFLRARDYSDHGAAGRRTHHQCRVASRTPWLPKPRDILRIEVWAHRTVQVTRARAAALENSSLLHMSRMGRHGVACDIPAENSGAGLQGLARTHCAANTTSCHD